MFLEYDWSFGVYRFRFGDTFTDFQGVRSVTTLAEARALLRGCNLKLGKKAGSRTWPITH